MAFARLAHRPGLHGLLRSCKSASTVHGWRSCMWFANGVAANTSWQRLYGTASWLMPLGGNEFEGEIIGAPVPQRRLVDSTFADVIPDDWLGIQTDCHWPAAPTMPCGAGSSKHIKEAHLRLTHKDSDTFQIDLPTSIFVR